MNQTPHVSPLVDMAFLLADWWLEPGIRHAGPTKALCEEATVHRDHLRVHKTRARRGWP